MISRRVLALLVLTSVQPLAHADGIEICIVPDAPAVVVDTADDVVADDGLTSLREAVSLAKDYLQCQSRRDIINFDLPTGTVLTLSDTLLIENDSVAIIGSNGLVLRSANTAAPLFTLARSTRLTNVALVSLTLDGLNVARTAPAIAAGATTELLLDSVLVTGFDAGTAAPGAISADGVLGLTIVDSLFSGNRGAHPERNGGGAISLASAVESGSFSVTGTGFVGNETPGVGHSGGALQVALSGGAPLTIAGSSFAYNEAGEDGGGLHFVGAALTVVNSTFSENVAAAEGGGMYLDGGELALSHATVVYNQAHAGGGVAGATGTSLGGSHVILALNTVTGSGANLYRTESVLEHSLVDATAGQLRLGALGLNGGLTLTHLLLTGSVAIDAGSEGDIVLPGIDQRGAPRVQGAAIDIGAVEVAPEADETAGSDGGGGGAPGPVWLLWLGLLALRQRPSPGHTRR